MEIKTFSYDDIKAVVNELRKKYPRLNQIPVPIDDFLEFDLELTIIPLLALRNVYEIDAFLSQDRSAIFVSDDLITRINYNSRLRFTKI